MILLKNIPFERQVQFLRDNICPYPDGLKLDALPMPQDVDAAGGLTAFHALLSKLYSDVSCIEGEGDDKKLTELINTMTFLHTIFVFGTLSYENSTHAITIDKAVLQKQYKKGNLSFRQRHVESHGLIMQYRNAQGVCNSLRKASEITLSYPQQSDLIPAVKAFVDNAESLEDGNDNITNSFGIFIKGDVEAALAAKSIRRSDLDPYRNDILRTVDSYKQDWVQLVDKLRSLDRLEWSGFLHYHASPSWGVSFAEKGKKPLLIFTLGSNVVFVEFTVPVDAAESIIRGRHAYSETIRGKIETFHCVNCPKKCKGANIIKIDGVSLCKGRAEARRIYVTLCTPEDFASIHTMLDEIYESLISE